MIFEWWMAAVIGWLGVEVIKMVVNHKASVRTQDEDKQVEDMHNKISEMHKTVTIVDRKVHWLKEVHDVRDDDGVPLWYVPRNWASKQEKIVSIVNEISHTVKDVAHIIEKVVDKLDKLN